MKKIFITVAFFASIGFASAQVDKDNNPQADIQDRIQQEPPSSTQIEMERAARIDTERKKNDANLQTEKKLKSQEKSKDFTKFNSDKSSPAKKDNTQGVKPVKKPRNK